MKSLAIPVLSILASMSGPLDAGRAAPLAPTGKWTVEYADSLCVLSRAYDTDTKKLTFGIRPWPMGDTLELVLLEPARYGVGVHKDKAKVTIGQGTPPIVGTYSSYVTAELKTRVMTIDIPHAALDALGAASTIDIAMAGKPPVSLVLAKPKRALAALSTCTDDLLRTWHVDPAEQAKVATPPAPISAVAEWISTDDYPADALSRQTEGTVSIVWLIDVDGKVKNCGIAATSGDVALDGAACAAITKRGRYRPALDKDGKPIAIHSTRRVVWRL